MTDDEAAVMVPGSFAGLPTRVPCIECPLRKDAIPGALGGWTPHQYVTALHGPADIACHKSKGFDEKDRERMRSCTGVAAFRASTGVCTSHPKSHTRAAIKHVAADPEHRAEGTCFNSAESFLRHHDTDEGFEAGWAVKPRSAP